MSGAGRRARVMALFAEQGPDRDQLCDLCLTQLTEISGAGVVVMTTLPARGAVCLSGPLSARIEDLQFTLGERPCVDAFAGGRPVIASDLAGAPYARVGRRSCRPRWRRERGRCSRSRYGSGR